MLDNITLDGKPLAAVIDEQENGEIREHRNAELRL